MTTVELIAQLHSLDINLWADGDHLRCNAPKGVLTPALQTELRDRKAELLAFLHAASGATRSSEPPLQPVSRNGSLPLSFAQQRLWFMEQLEPGTGVYNLPVAYRVRGRVDFAALEQSLNEIVRRHETLRTNFSVSRGKPVQVIAPNLKIKIELVDLCPLAGETREAEAARLVAHKCREPFDLFKGPLLRASLLQLAEEEHVLLVVLHHIVSDGWSMAVLFRELAVLYELFSQGRPSSLLDLPIQYADFAAWQTQWLRGQTLERQLSYWRKQLKSIPSLLELPTDHPRPSKQTFRGARQVMVVSKGVTDALRTLCHRESVTLFMMLLAAFKVLLFRYTGQHDIVIGTAIAGRNSMELEGLIGFFVNTLVMRTDLSGNPGFTTLLRRVRDVALEAYEHQDLPFEKLVEDLQPDRDLSRSPLVQVMFQVRNFSEEAVRLPGLNIEEFEFDFGLAKFDLSLHVTEKPEGLACFFRYNLNLFDDATIRRIGNHLAALLEGIVENPQQPISDLPILTDAEKRQLLNEQNAHPSRYVETQCIHQVFEAQVEKTPEAVAVVFEDQRLTYRELNARANRLARYLKKRGAGPETLVGLCVERSLEMIVGILAILKSGSAYVPLDPEYPKTRLAYILAETRIKTLLTKQRLLQNLAEFKGKALCLDRDRELFEQEREETPDITLEPENLAYVMYTSGSTGRPKGVLGCHQGAVNYLSYLHETYHLNGADIVLQLPSLSFDASVRDLIGPLTTGASVVVVNDFDAKEPAALLSKIREHGVTCLLSIVPTLLNALLEAGRSRDESHDSIQLILVSGEALPVATWQKAKELFGPKALLVNQYGPTECTMTSSYHPVTESDKNRDIAPLGRPIPNSQIYILDSHLNLVPTGVLGEITIGGLGLARGYMYSPELTAERFIPDPFSTVPGTRLYRTGDLARYRSDGNIDFLGRIDHQVKVRGFRIELGEIEAVLSQHPSVKAGAVAVRDDGFANQRLVAYVVPDNNVELDANGLGDFFRERLPEYMIPSLFVFLTELPLTPSRKVDRQALPDPVQRNARKTFIAPRTPAEAAIAAIWREFFGTDQVGIDDNFFELGGHSLQATQVVSCLRDLFRVELPLHRLFERPTVAGLARCIEEEFGSEPDPQQARPDLELLFLHQDIAELVQTIKGRVPEKPRPQVSHTTVPATSTFAVAQNLVDSAAVKIERRPLVSLLATGTIPPVDAAALGYLSDNFLQQAGLNRETAIRDWYDNLPCVTGIVQTSLGRIALIGLPRLRSELYSDKRDLVKSILEALEVCRQIGARTVSLMGLLPSATDYGDAIARACSGKNGLPRVTTGHATTVTAVVLTIKRILEEGGRDLAQENVAFLGMGSIGYTSLRLMLRSIAHPKTLMICDVYSKLDWLQKIRDQIIKDLGFDGSLHIIESRGKVPHAIYDASLIVGATNMPDVLDIDSLKPGTIVVDDSAPHCFKASEAVARFKAREDILFSEGGNLELPNPVHRIRYLPLCIEKIMNPAIVESFAKRHPFYIGGCALASLLLSRFDHLTPTLDLVDDRSCEMHYDLVGQLGYRAAGLHCENYILPQPCIQNFRTWFGIGS